MARKTTPPQEDLFASGALAVVQEPQIDFDMFWQAYPNKKSKPKAKALFERICKKTAPAAIMAGLEQAKLYDHRFRTKQYTPHPTTWLNAEGWNDDNQPTDDRGDKTGQQRNFESTISAFDLADQISHQRDLRKLGG